MRWLEACRRWWWFGPVLAGPLILWWLVEEADVLALIALVWLWTVGSLIGLFVSLWLSTQTWREYSAQAHRTVVDHVLELIAEANFRREVFRFIEFFALLIIGINVLTGISNVTVSRVAIVMVVALLFGNTVLDMRERRKTRALLRRPQASTRMEV